MDVGQTVAASFQAPTIFLIAQDLTKMQVDTNVDEADVGPVRVGQRGQFHGGRLSRADLSRRGWRRSAQAPINVQNVITYDVVVEVANPDLKLFPGMTANVKILTGRPPMPFESRSRAAFPSGGRTPRRGKNQVQSPAAKR